MTLERIAPALFVLLWSTGWLAPALGKDHATAETFLSARFLLAMLAFAAFSVASGARWPRRPATILHGIISGALLHGVYLGGVWWAIFNGVPASVSGVIAALQPLLTAALAPWLVGERLKPIQIFGLILGFAGIMIALSPSFEGVTPEVFALTAVPLAVNIVAMFGVVFGTIYQKRFLQEGDMRTNAVYQYLGALFVVVPAALLVEPIQFDGSFQVIAVLMWSVFVLSMGAVALLLYLIRRGQVSKAASLIYLIPPAVAIEAWIVLGEPLGRPMILGTIVVVIGVWLANRKPRNVIPGPA